MPASSAAVRTAGSAAAVLVDKQDAVEQ
jgi:hypothetical protein